MSSPIHHNETIVAPATPPGTSALAIVRLSGENAIEICNHVFSSKDLAKQDSHTIHFGNLKHKGELIDQVVVSLFRAPKSYTGEDIVEISSHGSGFIVKRIIEVLIECGARMARPGEFTMRAFLAGRMDLSQAEAVADLIAAENAMAHQHALHQMRGGFSDDIKALREELVHFASMIELELDFGEEDVEFADRGSLEKLIASIEAKIDELIRSFRLGNAIKNGVNTVIAGRPNAGKSTLLNALLNEERAIVSEIAGTTRDTIEEVLTIDGIPFRLIDTAGIREATDAIEEIGVQRAMEKIRTGTILIYVFDLVELSVEEVLSDLKKLNAASITCLAIGNKLDKTDREKVRIDFSEIDNLVLLSSKEKSGLKELQDRLAEFVTSDTVSTDGTIVTNARHFEALQKTKKSLIEVQKSLQSGRTGDLLALDIRQALNWLGEITGQITTDDLLENIFSKFCIGK